MSRIVIVDWLGRGGIAQTTSAWLKTLSATGHELVVATRSGRELDNVPGVTTHSEHERNGRFVAHAALARSSARLIYEWRPDLVIVQNFVIVPLERPVALAARSVGARLVYVIHDHRLHSAAGGTRAGLRWLLRRADGIWTHTDYVGKAVARYAQRRTTTVPHPVPPSLVASPVADRRTNASGVLRAVHFGVLKRGYKGTDVVLALAAAELNEWRFHLLGVGAPNGVSGVVSSPGYADAPELVRAVSAADVTLLPYRRASQSGAVVLAHVLGSVPLATAVGGIPEQIDNGVDGVLLPAGSHVTAWKAELCRLASEPERLAQMAAAGSARAWRDHRVFEETVGSLTSGMT